MRKLILFISFLVCCQWSFGNAKLVLEKLEQEAARSKDNHDKIAFHFMMANHLAVSDKDKSLDHLEKAKLLAKPINPKLLSILEAKQNLILNNLDITRQKIVEVETNLSSSNDFCQSLFYSFLAQQNEDEPSKFDYYWNTGLSKAILSRSKVQENSFYFHKYNTLKEDLPELANTFLRVADSKVSNESMVSGYMKVILGIVFGFLIIFLIFTYTEKNKVTKAYNLLLENNSYVGNMKNQLVIENERLMKMGADQLQTIDFLKKELSKSNVEVQNTMSNCSFIQNVLSKNLKTLDQWPQEGGDAVNDRIKIANISADVQGILDLQALQRGDLQASPTDQFKLYEFFQQKVAKYGGIYKNVQFKYDHFIPKYFKGDLALFDKTIESLINFAVNFSPDKKVEIQFRLKSFSEKSMNIEVELTTTPIHIPLEFQQLLKGDFKKEVFDESTTFYSRLFLIKQYAVLQNGVFEARKDHELNNTFLLSLPMIADIIPDQAALEDIKEANNLVQNFYRILVVEDNKINQMVVRSMLEKAGYVVETATDGEEAIKAVTQSDFSLILMDIQMPKMDGLKTTEYIRNLSNHKSNIPIVALTGSSFLSEREKAMLFGMNDHIAKPYNPTEILEVVKKHIGNEGVNLGA